MLTNKESKINEDAYKPKRSISSKIGNDLYEENNNSKVIKSRHRKMSSSYFLGSYISGDELNKFLQVYKGLNNDNSRYSNKNNNDYTQDSSLNVHKKNEINNLKNSLLNGKTNNTSNKKENNINEKIIPLANASFYSYSVENDNNNNKIDEYNEEGSVIIKGGDESLTNNCETKSNSYITNANSFNNNPFYELEKNSEKYSKEKSFIPIKNSLKYIKDKEERVTDSYLMALNGGESNQKSGKNQYLPTASIIEEEKSEFIESTSKKQSIINGARFNKEINVKKKKIENEFDLVKTKDNILEKSNDDENKENIDINIQNNYTSSYNNNIDNNKSKKNNTDSNSNITVRKCSRIVFDLNKIIIKNSHKNEIKRKCMRKNKENLLNSFYNLSSNKSILIPSSNNSCIQKKEENGIGNHINNNPKSNINKRSINTKTKENLELNKSSSKSLVKFSANSNLSKKKRTFSYSGGYISYLYHQRFNTDNCPKSNKVNNEKKKYNITKFVYRKNNKHLIYHIYKNNNPKNNNFKKSLNKSANNPLVSGVKINPKVKIPHNKFDKSSIQRNNENSTKSIKINLNSNIYIENKENKENKIFLDISHRRAISIPKDKFDRKIIHKKMFSSIDGTMSLKEVSNAVSIIHHNMKNYDKNRNNTSKLLNICKNKNFYSRENNKIPLNSDSHSCRTREKIRDRIINHNIVCENFKRKRICMKKANSGLFKSKIETSDNKEELDINISNKKQTLIILKEKIIFLKSYEKIDVLEKIRKTLNCNKSCFIILCDNKYKSNNNDLFIFRGLFKYYENQKRFIKIYGDEKCPNIILTKDINNSNYKIYENKIIQNEENKIQFLFEPIVSFYFSFNSFIICKN